MSAAQSTVRVHAATRDKLRELASDDGRPIPELIGELVEQEEGRRMLDQHNMAMQRLREDPDAWAAWKGEMAIWEATLMDGLREL